jgi:predicted small secreted protein
MAAACNTVAGAGEDIQGAGNAIEDTADEAKQDMQQ